LIKLPPDITFLIQIVSFLIFWGLMRMILFKPVQEALAKRGVQTTGATERAAELHADAERLQAEAAVKLTAARDGGTAAAVEIKKNAERDEQAILERFATEATALLEKERAVTASQVEEVKAPLRADAEALADEVVARVLGRAA